MPANEQEAFNDIIYNRIKQVNSIPSELNKQVMGLLTVINLLQTILSVVYCNCGKQHRNTGL